MLYDALFVNLLLMFFAVVFIKLQPSIFVYVMVVALYISSYLIRDYAPSNLWNLILHIIIGVLVCLPKMNIGIKVLLVIIDSNLLGEAFLYAINGYKIKQLDDMPWPTFLVSLIIYAYGFFMNESIMLNSAYVIPVILLILYYLMIYVEGLRTYVNATKDVSGLPLKRIISTNTMIVFLVTLFLIVGIFLGNVLGLHRTINTLGKGVVAVFKLFAAFFVAIWRIIALLFSSSGGGSASAVVVEEKVTGKYVADIGNSFEFVLKGAVVLIAIYVVYKIAIKIIKRLVIKRKLSTDIIEAAEISYKDEGKRLYKNILKNNKSNVEEKIRKYYRLRVLRNKHEIVLNKQKTAEDIRKTIKEKELGDIDEVTLIYSNVRYGNMNPDKNILRRMNRLTKQ